MLNHVYGGTLKPGVAPVFSNLFEYDQKVFFNNRPSSNSMDDTGYVYIPVYIHMIPLRPLVLILIIT